MTWRRKKQAPKIRSYIVEVYEDACVDEELEEYRPGVKLITVKRGWRYVIRTFEDGNLVLPIIWSTGKGYENKDAAIAAALIALEAQNL